MFQDLRVHMVEVQDKVRRINNSQAEYTMSQALLLLQSSRRIAYCLKTLYISV